LLLDGDCDIVFGGTEVKECGCEIELDDREGRYIAIGAGKKELAVGGLGVDEFIAISRLQDYHRVDGLAFGGQRVAGCVLGVLTLYIRRIARTWVEAIKAIGVFLAYRYKGWAGCFCRSMGRFFQCIGECGEVWAFFLC